MFNPYAITALVALISTQVVRADVVPSEPGPGSSYTAGQTCRVTWDADTGSPTAWKNMAIQLMSGSNFDMQSVTTVATGQDGTVDGVFTFTCPEVTPYSNIYFYQFTATGATSKAWTTRFTITSPSGGKTDPENPTQPGSGDAIPWGVGALADPSQAVAPPASAGDAASPAQSGAASSASSSGAMTAAASSSSSPVLAGATSSAASRIISSSASVRSSATGSSSTAAASSSTAASDNGAVSTLANSRLVQAAVLLSATVLFL